MTGPERGHGPALLAITTAVVLWGLAPVATRYLVLSVRVFAWVPSPAGTFLALPGCALYTASHRRSLGHLGLWSAWRLGICRWRPRDSNM